MSAVLQNLRSKLFAGLATLIPVMLTFYFLRFLYVSLDKISAPLVKEYLEWEIPGVSILFNLVFIYLLGKKSYQLASGSLSVFRWRIRFKQL